MILISKDFRSYGHIEVSSFGQVQLKSSKRPGSESQVLHERYCWRLGRLLSQEFPAGRTIAFDVYTDRTGFRRLTPVGGNEVFVPFAFAAGLAILAEELGLTAEQRIAYRGRWLIYRKSRVMAEHFDRAFKYSRDLFIRQSGREGDGNYSVLPEDIGLNAEGRGDHWRPSRLCHEGRERASEDGVTRLTNDVAIPYGLRAAAELNPLPLDDAEIPRLMRNALFAPADVTAVEPELVQEVYARTIDYLERHDGDSSEEFSRCFFGGGGNVFKTIARGRMLIAKVRAAFLELGWQAYAFVAQCIGRFAKEFQDAMPTPLSPVEQPLFSHMYEPQSYLGGLSLMQLMERADCFGPVINDLWSSPGDLRTIAVLHRILSYYAEMARVRRSADRRTKATNGRLEVTHHDFAESKSETVDPVPDQDVNPNGALIQLMLREFARQQEEQCDVCGTSLECELIDLNTITRDPREINIAFICPDHRLRRQRIVPFGEFRDVARQIGVIDEDEIEPPD